MDARKMLSCGIESDGVDGHFFPQLQSAEPADTLTILFNVGADKKDLILEFGNGDTLAIVRQFDMGKRTILGRTIIYYEVDTRGLRLEGIIEEFAKSGEGIPVAGKQLFYDPGMGG
jgi:hypothetical protein